MTDEQLLNWKKGLQEGSEFILDKKERIVYFSIAYIDGLSMVLRQEPT